MTFVVGRNLRRSAQHAGKVHNAVDVWPASSNVDSSAKFARQISIALTMSAVCFCVHHQPQFVRGIQQRP